MTKPIESAPASTSPTLPPATPSETSGTGPSRPVGMRPDLGRAPALPAGARTAGASTAGRAPLPVQAQPSSSSQAGASSSAPPARAPSAQLADVAQQLAGLEQERKALSAQIDQAKEVRRAAADRAPSARGSAALRKLQDRVDQSAKKLQRLTVSRAEQLGQLERAERLLASCERSQKALSLTEASGSRSEPVTASPAPTLDPSQAVRPSVPPSSRMSAEEVAARERVQELRQTSEAVKIEQARAKEALAECRAEVHRLTAGAESILRNYGRMMNSVATTGLNNYLRSMGLPDINLRPARGATDTRYARYLEHFTEVGDDGARRMKQAVVDDPRTSFAVFSAHFCAMTPNIVIDSFLNCVLSVSNPAMERNRDLITAALRNGGEGLEGAVRRQVIAGFDYCMQLTEALVNRGERPAEMLSGPRRERIGGRSTVRRPDVIEAAARGRQLVQLQALPAHRTNIIDGGVQQACALLRDVVAVQFRAASGQLAQAQARLDETTGALLSVIQRGVDVARQLRGVNEELDRLAGERQKRLAAEAKDDTKPSAAAIPQTVTAASSSTDSEGRRLKLRGDVGKHTDAATLAKSGIAQADKDIRKATAELRRNEAELETAAAAHARHGDGARRKHDAQREELAGLRRQLTELDQRIERARNEMHGHLAHETLISKPAWERAVQRHVEPDDVALRARAKFTGYSAAYASQADMAKAVADIHVHASQQPELQAVLGASTQAEFEHAAAAAGGVIDRVHDHGRPVGRGFSNDPDRTARAADLTQSNYSLQLVQGRVVVSHLYPYVPHRQLQAA